MSARRGNADLTLLKGWLVPEADVRRLAGRTAVKADPGTARSGLAEDGDRWRVGGEVAAQQRLLTSSGSRTIALGSFTGRLASQCRSASSSTAPLGW